MTVRLGVLSTARIATQKVIPAIREARACEVVAIASRDRSRAAAAADALGIERAHGSYNALLEDHAVDAVYIPLPNHLHAPWTVAAAEAGKHVLCEKPLALSAAQGRQMLAACQGAGVVFMEAYMYRLHPQWRKAVDLVTSGRLGTLHAVQTYFAYHNPDPANIRNIADYGGGALMDIGCYAIDLSRMLFDAEPLQVSGAVKLDPGSGVDVVSSGLLTFPDGGQSTFLCCTRCEPGQWVHIVGSSGRLVIEVPFNTPADVPTRLTLIKAAAGGQPHTIELPPANHYTIQADAFAKAVLEGTDVPIPPESGLANVEIIEALRTPTPAGNR